MHPPALLVDRSGRPLAILDALGADELWLRILHIYELTQQRWQCAVEVLDAVGQAVRWYTGLARYTFELVTEASVRVGQRVLIVRTAGRVLVEPVREGEVGGLRTAPAIPSAG
jgi:hypothetical protein